MAEETPGTHPLSPFLPIRSGRRWAFAVACFTMLLTLVPYLIGAMLADGRRFMWLGYNLDDSCVYLSWMRQAADGSTRVYNLFTTDSQNGMAPNPFFFVLGQVSHWTGLPLLAVYHGARLLCGLGLLVLVWELIRLLLAEFRAQRLAFLFVCFSAGLGWLPFWWDGSLPAPIDAWQPEAITFLSLLLSPLFCFSLLLQVGMIFCLFLAERKNCMRFALLAGMQGFLLGLIHTYDIITITAIWSVYLIAHTIRSLTGKQKAGANLFASWSRAIVAGLFTFPAVAYIAYQLSHESVFRARANVPTLSVSLFWVLSGYGLTLAFAIAGGYALLKRTTPPVSEPSGIHEEVSDASSSRHAADKAAWVTGQDAVLLLIIWAIVNIAVSYLPVAFQRKMLQGEHFPIAILAGIGTAWLFQRISFLRAERSFPLAALTLTVVLSLTNLFFVQREIVNYSVNRAQTQLQRPYLQPGEVKALEWITANTPPGTAIQPLPWITPSGQKQIAPFDTTLASFTPGLTHRPVYCGHWGETPDFRTPDGKGKLSEITSLLLPKTTDEQRIAQLKKMKVRYLIFSQTPASDRLLTRDSTADALRETTEIVDRLIPVFRNRIPLPDYLQVRYENPEAVVYEVVLPD